MATINNQSPDEYRRREIALELMEAYVSLTCCCIFFYLVLLFPLYLHLFLFFFYAREKKNSEKRSDAFFSLLQFVVREYST